MNTATVAANTANHPVVSLDDWTRRNAASCWRGKRN